MDGVDVAKPDDISVRVGALLGIYFIFGVKYAENVRKTNFYATVHGWY